MSADSLLLQDGPAFREPWEAHAFALAVKLHERGLFTWREWADALSEQIAAAKQRGEPDRGDTYYQHWLAALESLVASKGAASPRRAATHRARLGPCGRPHAARPADRAQAGGLPLLSRRAARKAKDEVRSTEATV